VSCISTASPEFILHGCLYDVENEIAVFVTADTIPYFVEKDFQS